MSKEFYNYLARRTIDFFNAYSIRRGEKFILKLDSDAEVEKYYQAIEAMLDGDNSIINYRQTDDEVFETVSFMTGNDKSIQLVIVPEINITNAYLTRLRNTVSEGDTERAIFIVCHNPIDSIAGGTESLQKEGMPFHKSRLISDIEKNIKQSDMCEGEQQVLYFDLNNKDADVMDMYSISDYADILSILYKGHLDTDDFRSFGLFFDDEISTISFSDTNTMKKRIDDNYKYFKQIDDSLKYGNIEDDLENVFDNKLLKKIKDNIKSTSDIKKWDEGISYADVIASVIRNDERKKPITLEKTEVIANGVAFRENVDFFVRNEKETAAGRRKRHILIFNPDCCEKIEISVGISEFLGKNDISFEDKKDNTGVSVKVSGKKIVIEFAHKDISINKAKLKCIERTEKFEISYCVINYSRIWFDEITSCFAIESKTKKKSPKSLIINCDSEELIFNRRGTVTEKVRLEPDITISPDLEEKYILTIDENSFKDDNTANAVITLGNFDLPVIFKASAPINSSITGVKIQQYKLKGQQSFLYQGNNKLTFGTNEYNTREELRLNLITEEFIISSGCFSCSIVDEKTTEIDLKISDNLTAAYRNFIKYFKYNDTLPSLAYYDENLTELALEYLRVFISELEQIEEDKPLTIKLNELLKIGTVVYPSSEEIAFSPVHPINVAYQLCLTDESKGHDVREDILKKLSSDNLIPFIHDEKGRLFKVREQMYSPDWTYYCNANQKKYKGSRNFVSKLTCEKIQDFCGHFKYLFGNVGRNKLIINAVNMGDCRNIFRGIVDYYKSQIREPANMLSIIINVYDDIKTYNVFETLLKRSALKSILSEMGIKENSKDYSESEFINILMTNLKYFRKQKSALAYDYCHLAFIEMDHTPKEEYSNKFEIRSGTMLNGLISGVTSIYYGETNSYRTGYGSKFNLNIEENTNNFLMRLTGYYNSLMQVYGTNSPYSSKNAICTAIDERETEMINKTYDSSNWVVFVDPKVDLNFFKNDKKDVMIIHYSDQHTTSSGYDAITVTRKTELYENILKEFLEEKESPLGDNSQIRKMIDMFNAVNGDWLLKLISSKSNFSKEKISIQSAIKLALAFFKSDDIIWVPISFEEIIRVSGSVGYAKDGGLFTSKNLGYENGVTSDDLLMFGIEISNGKVLVHLYPLEVKIGYKDINEVVKATEQIKQTRKILDENLVSPKIDNPLQTKIYRNFIAQLAVISADKLNLYKVWEHQDWEMIVNSEIRGRLLNDDFTITDTLHSDIGDGILISFKDGIYMRDVEKKNDVTVIRFLRSDGDTYILKSVDEIYQDIQKMDTVKQYLSQKAVRDTTAYQHTVYESEKMHTEEKREHSDIIPDFLEINPDNKTTFVPDKDVSNETEIFDTVENDVQSSVETDVINSAVERKVKSEEGMQILFGNDVNTSKSLYWYPNNTEKIMHPNTGIIGTMGTGKTQFTKSLILQLMKEQCNNPGEDSFGILIFDYKGDYNKSKKDFVDATNAKVYDLYHLPFNPLSISANENSKPMLPLHIANTFKDTLAKVFDLGNVQEATLRDCIMQAYEFKGIDKGDKSTWDRIPPVLDTVFKIYQDSESFKKDSLYSALSELHEFEIFETEAEKTVPLYDLVKGVTVINLAGYSSSIQNFVVAITLDLFYSQMQTYGHSLIDGKLRQLTKFILVDEADNFLNIGLPSLKKILKEGREFGVGTILSTQFLEHFDTQEDDFAKYIYTWIVHNVADLSVKDVKNLFNFNAKQEAEEFCAEIKKLKKHHSFVKFGDSSAPHYIKDKAFFELLEEL